MAQDLFSNPEIRRRLRLSTPPHVLRPWVLPLTDSPKINELKAKVAESKDSEQISEIVADFLTELETVGTPIIEEPVHDIEQSDSELGYSLFTFVWVGEAVGGVLLHLNRISDVLDPAETKLIQIEGTPIHYLTLKLPKNWLASYLLVKLPEAIDLAPSLHGGANLALLSHVMRHVVEDPYAREKIPNKMYSGPVELAPKLGVARGQDAAQLELWKNSKLSTETVGELIGPVSKMPLKLKSWIHPKASTTAVSVLFIDGEVWQEQFPIIQSISEEIETGTLPPIRLLFLESAHPKQRDLDLAGSEAESGQIFQQLIGLLPELQTTKLIVAGQSFGGLFALNAAIRHSELVSAVIAQSPSLWWPNLPPEFSQSSAPVKDWFFEFAQQSKPAAKVLLHGGSYEWTLIERIRDAAAMLRQSGALLQFQEFPGGHDVLAWQTLLLDAIKLSVKSV